MPSKTFGKGPCRLTINRSKTVFNTLVHEFLSLILHQCLPGSQYARNSISHGTVGIGLMAMCVNAVTPSR